MMTETTTPATTKAAAMLKIPVNDIRVTPIPGALSKQYERLVFYAQLRTHGRKPSRGKDYPTRRDLMKMIGQESSSAWGHIDSARNKISLRGAHKLACKLCCPVRDIVIINEAAKPLLKRLESDAREEYQSRQDLGWRTKMCAWKLPLTLPPSWEALTESLATPDVRLKLEKPRAEEATLEMADLIDDMEGRLRLAGELHADGKTFRAAKVLEEWSADLKVEDKGVRRLHLLWGRYVERYEMGPPVNEEFEEPFRSVALRRVLVVKLSRREEEKDFTLDRSGEARYRSAVEELFDGDFDTGLMDFIAWCGGRDFREEIR